MNLIYSNKEIVYSQKYIKVKHFLLTVISIKCCFDQYRSINYHSTVSHRTVSKDNVAKVSVGKMLLINFHFKRVAVDSMSPITPARDKENGDVLTLIDYVIHYPKAVLLKNIDTETVAEALLELYSLIEIPKEVLNNLETYWIACRKCRRCSQTKS